MAYNAAYGPEQWVWLDSSHSNAAAGTVIGTNGTSDMPCDNFNDAFTIAANLGSKKIAWVWFQSSNTTYLPYKNWNGFHVKRFYKTAISSGATTYAYLAFGNGGHLENCIFEGDFSMEFFGWNNVTMTGGSNVKFIDVPVVSNIGGNRNLSVSLVRCGYDGNFYGKV